MTGRSPYLMLARLQPGRYAANLVLQLLRSGLPLIPALLVRAVLDRLLDGDFTVLVVLLSVLAGTAVARVTVLLTTTAHTATSSARGQAQIVRAAARRLLGRPGAEPRTMSTGDTISRLALDSTALADMMSFTQTMLGSAFQALLAIVVMALVSPLITAVVIVPLVAMGLLSNLLSARIRDLHRRSQESAAQVRSFLREALDGVQAIQLAGAEERIVAEVARRNGSRGKTATESMLFSNLFLASLWGGVSNLCSGLVLVLAARGFEQGSFSPGDLALFVAYIARVTEFVTLLGRTLPQLRQSEVSLQRIADTVPSTEVAELAVRTTPVTRTAAPRPAMQMLRTSGLVYRYPSSGRGVRGVDLTIDRGDFLVVCGRVGAGKTTLLRLVLGLLTPDAGTVRWNDEVVSGADAFPDPPGAYLPQAPHLFSDTIRTNITLGRAGADDRVDSATSMAVLDRDLAELPHGLDTVVGPRGVRLSGGQRQRVAAARLFAAGADLCVLDDLSSALDVGTEQELYDSLVADRSRTCMVAANRRPAFEQATRIVVLRAGAVVGNGTAEQLLDTCPEFIALWDGRSDGDAGNRMNRGRRAP